MIIADKRSTPLKRGGIQKKGKLKRSLFEYTFDSNASNLECLSTCTCAGVCLPGSLARTWSCFQWFFFSLSFDMLGRTGILSWEQSGWVYPSKGVDCASSRMRRTKCHRYDSTIYWRDWGSSGLQPVQNCVGRLVAGWWGACETSKPYPTSTFQVIRTPSNSLIQPSSLHYHFWVKAFQAAWHKNHGKTWASPTTSTLSITVMLSTSTQGHPIRMIRSGSGYRL